MAESEVQGCDEKGVHTEIEWDENLGYAMPWFEFVHDGKRLVLNCYDEYIVHISDKGLMDMKKVIDEVVKARNLA